MFPGPQPFAWPPALALAPNLYLPALALNLYLLALATLALGNRLSEKVLLQENEIKLVNISL